MTYFHTFNRLKSIIEASQPLGIKQSRGRVEESRREETRGTGSTALAALHSTAFQQLLWKRDDALAATQLALLIVNALH